MCEFLSQILDGKKWIKKLRTLIANEIKDLKVKIERGKCVQIKKCVVAHNPTEEDTFTSKYHN